MNPQDFDSLTEWEEEIRAVVISELGLGLTFVEIDIIEARPVALNSGGLVYSGYAMCHYKEVTDDMTEDEAAENSPFIEFIVYDTEEIIAWRNTSMTQMQDDRDAVIAEAEKALSG